MVAGGLTDPIVGRLSSDEAKAASIKNMEAFAKENHIEIVIWSVDHADRTWTRYFDELPPFENTDIEREERRKNIPDAWILEAAIDTKENYGEIVAGCADNGLCDALEQHEIQSYHNINDLILYVESEIFDQDKIVGVEIAVPDVKFEKAQDASTPSDPVSEALQPIEENFKRVGRLALGLIGAMETPTKEELISLMQSQGIIEDDAIIVLEQLKRSDLITETENYYLAKNKELCKTAAKDDEIEALLIEILGNG